MPRTHHSAPIADRFIASTNCGRALLAAQQKVTEQFGANEWLPWLDANFVGTREDAAKHMKLASDCGY